jgi:cyclic-di-GMP-binding protein
MSTPDSVQLLAEFGSRLDAVHSQSDLRLALQIEMVDHADRGARELLEHLEARYFASGGNTESAEQSRVWGPVSLYCAQLEAAYMHLARQFQTYSQGWAEGGDKIPMVVARAMRATSMRLKWQLMRYLPVEKDIWQTLSQLWAFVEDKSMGQARVVVYKDKSTLPREFLKPMMLAVSAADSLPALEVDIAYRVIDHLSDRFELQRHPAKACNFFVDIDRWTAPERYTPVSVVRSGARFFGPGRVMEQIDELISRLAGGEIVPGEMNLHGISDMGAVIHVLEHLGRHWWGRRPQRRAERRLSLSQIGVVHGFDEIMTRLSSDEIVEQMPPPAETWSVENESDDGYGAVLPMSLGEWLHVGKVLAVKPSDTRIWAVGIVRHLAAQEGGQRNVGIELLARGARLVTLRQRTDAQQTWKALLLPSHSGGNASLGEVSLLLPADSFLPDSSLEMEVYSTSYILEPRILIEHGNEFEMARYRIVQRVT